MSKREQLNQLLNEEKIARATVEQLCNDWEWTLSDKETTIVNNITINKGKVTAIEITKEDNSTIEMLRETIRQMNQNMNDMIKQHEEEITKLKEQYEQQMLDMTSEFEYEYECAINKREEQIKELEDKIDGMEYIHRGVVAGYEGQLQNKQLTIESLEKQIADAKEDKVRAEIIKRKNGATIEVVDDPNFNNEPEEKPATNNKPMNNPIDLTYTSLHVTHDAIKAIAHDKANGVTFHFVWKAGQEKLPCYSATGARGTWSRMNGTGMYHYGKQIVEDFKQLAEEKIISKTKDGRVKITKVNKSNKPEDKPVVKETKEVAVETNDDPLGNTDDMEFDCFDC